MSPTRRSILSITAGQRLHYVYLGHVRHPSLQSIRVSVFFKLCRLEGISFNLGTQVSVVI